MDLVLFLPLYWINPVRIETNASRAFYEYLNNFFPTTQNSKKHCYYSLNGNKIESVITYAINQLRIGDHKKKKFRGIGWSTSNWMQNRRYKIRIWRAEVHFLNGEEKNKQNITLINMRPVILLFEIVCLAFEWLSF